MTIECIKQFIRRHIRRESGNAFLYILAVMIIFGFLGAAMISMHTSATFITTAVSNDAKQARFLAESGMRYAVSELRNAGYRRSVISRLNTTGYNLSGDGTFDINVFGKWFRAAANHSGTGSIPLDVPEGTLPQGFAIPQNAYLVNLESARDALYFAGAWNADFDGQISPAPGLTEGAVSANLNLSDSLVVLQDQPVLLAVPADGTYGADTDIAAGGTLRIAPEAADFFPGQNGAFYIESSLNEKRLNYYAALVDQGSYAELTNLSEGLTVSPNDFVILAERNHRITAEGASGSAASGGSIDLAMDFRQNIANPQLIPPPPLDLPPDISPDDIITDVGSRAPPESDPGVIAVDTDADTITLGGGVASAFGAVFFGGDVTLGGFNVCTGGKCRFGDGLRAFFIVDYQGSGAAGGGDGFTFTVMNGTDNEVNSVGGKENEGELLGYAGDGTDSDDDLIPGAKSGLLPPKMALEFDTFTNAAAYDSGTKQGRNDPDDAAWSNRDLLHFVFWGNDAVDLFEDNVHDPREVALGAQWVFSDPFGDILTRPAVDPGDGTVYFGSRDDNLWALNPDGTEKWRFDTTDDIYASPALATDGTVYVGSDAALDGGNGVLFAVNPDGTQKWRYAATPQSNVRSAPALDSIGNVYFSTWKNDNNFYGLDASGSDLTGWPSPKDASLSSEPYPQADAQPAVDEANDAVYFASMYSPNNALLHAFHLDGTEKSWSPVTLAGPGFSSPTVNLIDGHPNRGTIYIGNDGGSDEGFLYAFNPDGTQQWRTTISWTNPRSKPAVGPDGTIYIGNDDDSLYAVHPTGTVLWSFPTGGNVRGEPLVGSDGAIYFGSDDGYLYAVDAEGNQLDRFDFGFSISRTPDEQDNWADWVYAASPAQGPDGTVYIGNTAGELHAFAPGCAPQNIKDRNFTYEDLQSGVHLTPPNTVSSSDHWLNSDGTRPWAVRMEVARSTAANPINNKYGYTLKMWIRQCNDADCTDILGTYFQDTRITYAIEDPDLEQAMDMCAPDHTKFDTFLFGFTVGSGGATQNVILSEPQIGFIRPGDFVITSN